MPHQCTNCGRTFADGSKEMLSGCPDCSGTKFQFRPDGFERTDDGAADDSPDSTASPDPDLEPDGADDSFDSDPAGDAVSRTVGSAAATVRDLVGSSTSPDTTAASPPSADAAGANATTGDLSATDDDDDIIVAESEPLAESDAQADARTQFADPDEMPQTAGFEPTGDAAAEPDTESSLSADADAAPPDPSTERGTDADAAADDAAPRTDGPDRSVADEPDAERTDRPDLAQLREELNEQFESIRVVEPGQYELNLMELYDREEYIIALQEDGRYSIQMPETWRDSDV